MKFFYWLMAILIAGTFVPSAMYFALFIFTGLDEALQQAKRLWTLSRLFAMLGANILIWGHVIVEAWRLVFR